MHETTQKYSFDNQEKLNQAISALSAFDPDLYNIVSSGPVTDLDANVAYELNIWFADLQTVCIPYCEIVSPLNKDNNHG